MKKVKRNEKKLHYKWGDYISIIKLIKQLRKIEKECDRYPPLEKRLEPYAKDMMKTELTKGNASAFIKEYKKAKKELKIRWNLQILKLLI